MLKLKLILHLLACPMSISFNTATLKSPIVSRLSYDLWNESGHVEILYDYFTKVLRNESYNLKFAPYFLDPNNVSLNYGPTSIIDSPAERLTLEMINFDYDQNLKDIERVFYESNLRIKTKPIYIINRGPGSGTTRTLEELKVMVNKRPECLAIAITYGHDWVLTIDEVKTFTDVSFLSKVPRSGRIADVGAVFSVITRMTAMLYGLSLGQAIQLYRENLSLISEMPYHTIEYALAGFIKAIIEQLRQAGRSVSKVLFLIDESAQVNKVLNTLMEQQESWLRADAVRIIHNIAFLVSSCLYAPMLQHPLSSPQSIMQT